VSDVATAIYEGTDAVMLSAESRPASSRWRPSPPWTASPWRLRPIRWYRTIIDAQRSEPEATGADAIAAAAREIAENPRSQRRRVLDLLRRYRVAGRPRAGRGRRSCRFRQTFLPGRNAGAGMGRAQRGLREDVRDQDDMVDRACRLAFKEGLAQVGQRLIVVAGVPFGTPGATNMVRIAVVSSSVGEAD